MTEGPADQEILVRPQFIPARHGRKLSATRFSRGDSTGAGQPAILFVHGFDSDQSGYADRARAAVDGLNAVSLTFDLSGHGQTGGDRGSITTADNVADICAAFDTLAADHSVDKTRIGICGASYGAYLAAYVTADRPVARLLLRAPGLYADHTLSEPLTLPRVSDAKVSVPELKRRLQRYPGDVLVLEGEFDEVIPRDVIRFYLRAFPNVQHSVIPGAVHALGDPKARTYFQKEIVRFFGGM